MYRFLILEVQRVQKFISYFRGPHIPHTHYSFLKLFGLLLKIAAILCIHRKAQENTSLASVTDYFSEYGFIVYALKVIWIDVQSTYYV